LTSQTRLSADDRAWLRSIAGDDVSFDLPMSRRTTLRIGGPADAWVEPRTVDALAQIVRGCTERELAVTPLGGGSNLLVRDGGIRGVVLATRNLRAVDRVGETGIRVQAGASTGKLLSEATRWELGGVEFLGGVPGSVGGGLMMNAGTYLGEFKDVTTEVASVILADGTVVRRDNAACGFVYRGSDLPRDEVVVEATLELTSRARTDIEADVRSLRDRRNEREPSKVANAGSMFKNPPDDYAGRLIEAAGLKGTRVGGAECSPAHANWLVNTGAATASDMLTLIERVRTRVEQAHGIVLELEVRVIGEG